MFGVCIITKKNYLKSNLNFSFFSDSIDEWLLGDKPFFGGQNMKNLENIYDILMKFHFLLVFKI